ncbi:MAG: RAMP superfamily CRISPR-associated protein [Actinomycetales bacterium]
MTTPVHLIEVDLVIDQAWAIGGLADADDVEKLPVQRGLNGEPYLPATSLVGNLREHLLDMSDRDEEPVAAVLGEPPERMPENSDDNDLDEGGNRVPSPLWVLGTRVRDATITSHGSTAIDPQRGAAKPGSLRTVERAESTGAATMVTWFMEFPGELPSALLDGLSTWKPYVGRGRSIGQGRARVTAIRVNAVDLDEPSHLTWWLGERHTWYDRALNGENRPDPPPGNTPDPPEISPATPPWSLEHTWIVADPVAIGDGAQERANQEAAPGRGGQRRLIRQSGQGPLMPGSSLKGIFRHRCDFILEAIGVDADDRESIRTHLFGYAPAKRDEPGGRRGELRFHDATFENARLCTHAHVAIDRITGGAEDNKLFFVEAVQPGASVTTGIEADTAPAQPIIDLFGWVVRDLHESVIGIGGGAMRGYGSLRIADPDQASTPPPLNPSDFHSLAEELRTDAQT